MVNKLATLPAALAVIALTAFSTGCSHRSGSEQTTGAAEFASALKGKVTTDAMMAHLSKLQDIANANNGTRAVGTPAMKPVWTMWLIPCETAVLTCRRPSSRRECSMPRSRS